MASGDTPDERRSQAADDVRRRDTQDYDRELAGIEGHHITRFFSGAASKMARLREQEQAEQLIRSLAELMRDPMYRARYERFGTTLNEAQQWADQTEAKLRTALEAVNAKIDDMLDSAPRLPNGGPRVFRLDDGGVIDEFGNAVSPDIAAGIVWPESAARGEDYLAALDRRAALSKGLEDIENFQLDTLGPAQNRYSDQERGISIDEMDRFEAEFKDRIQSIERHLSMTAPDVFAAPAAESPSAAQTGVEGFAPVEKPRL